LSSRSSSFLMVLTRLPFQPSYQNPPQYPPPGPGSGPCTPRPPPPPLPLVPTRLCSPARRHQRRGLAPRHAKPAAEWRRTSRREPEGAGARTATVARRAPRTRREEGGAEGREPRVDREGVAKKSRVDFRFVYIFNFFPPPLDVLITFFLLPEPPLLFFGTVLVVVVMSPLASYTVFLPNILSSILVPAS
jgi:hypothetical protein